MTRDAIYQMEALRMRYGDRLVLSLDRLAVHAGETLCLVGPTGAGKSTLLRLLAGLEQPTGGKLLFGSHDLAKELLSASQRRITLVFQRPLLLSGTVLDNVEYGLRLRGLARRQRREQVERVIDQLGLTPLASRSARTLSGGEMQMVALARALVLEPEVLLLDEPTAQLDPARVALVEQVVREAHQRTGGTVVCATHNLFQARRIADRVALLLEGRLVELAATEEFFTAPRDPRSVAFVSGEMIY